MLKKLITILTIFSLSLGSIVPMSLYADEDIGYEGRVCRDLGILKGNTGVVDSAYLNTRPSRLQAAIMFLRLKGLEQDALSYTGHVNFKDSDTVAWKEGRNVLSYLKNHPELGWIGDGVNFLPYNPIDSKAYYKVLLESLGYKQKIDGDGDFEWNSVLEFAEAKGLHKVADVKTFTVKSLAVATVEALGTKMKNSGKKLIEHLVDIGDVDRNDAIALGLYSEGLEAEVKTVRAISNSKVEVVFEEAVNGSDAADEDLYDIRNLDIKNITVKNAKAIIIDTSAMTESTNYTLVFNDRNYSFKGLKKDSNAPKLIKAECKDTDLLELTFDRVLDNITAQDTDTYTIAGADVKSAELDSTNTKVKLITSGIQSGRSYELKIHSIRNGDGVLTKLITKRFTGKKDTYPPKLNKLTVQNNSRLLLEFSDSSGLEKAAAENESNYRITSGSGDLEVISAKAVDKDDDGLLETVELVTESQTVGRSYTLRITDISDNSVIGNRISKEIKKDFRGKAEDKSAPTVAQNPKAITNNIIEIVFKDANALNVESACDPDNYELDEDLYIEEIRIKNPSDLYSEAGRTVHLVTSEMEKSEYYTLIIKEVEDEFGNQLKASSGSGYKKYKFRGMAEDNTPPYVTFVECIDGKIEIKFDNQLDEASAENEANYLIDGLALVTKAELLGDGKSVRLTVSSLASDKSHTIRMNNIKDISGNSLYNVNVSVVYNGNSDDTDSPEVLYIQAMNEEEIWVYFDEEVNAKSAKLKASGVVFEQVGNVLEDGIAVVMKASSKMDDREYEVTSLTGVRDLRGNAYIFEEGLEFYGTDMENSPPEVSDWQQLDVTRFRVIFTEPVKLIKDGVSGIKNPGGVSLSWHAKLNPQEEDTNEAYSTVDYIASKAIPAGKEYSFNFTAMVSDYIGKAAFDEDDDYSASNATILEAYLEDDEDPYIEYVEAITRTKAQVVFTEAIRKEQPGTYKIKYYDDNNKLKYIDISRVEVDSEDDSRVNIFTEDEMTQEYVYTLIPISAAVDIAGNRLDTDDVEIDFEGSNIMSSEYVQGVEFQGAYSFKVTKSSKIYSKITSLYELDEDGTAMNNIIDGSSTRVYDNVHRVTAKKPLLRGVRYKVTVDGMEYRFYGGVQDGDIELELPEREIIFYDRDVKKYDVEVFRADGDKLDVDEKNGGFFIDSSEKLRNGEWIYIYVIRDSDDVIIYGDRIKLEGMPEASSSNEITGFRFKSLEPDAVGSIDEDDKIIRVAVPFGTAVSDLAASYNCSEGAVVKVGTEEQVSGVTKNDFSKEVVYTVIAEDGSKATYRVIVTVEDSIIEKKIKSFIFEEFEPDVIGVIDQDKLEIVLKVPYDTDITSIAPYIETTEGTKVSPASGEAVDFSGERVYTVTARDGSKQKYLVKVSRLKSSECLIKSFVLESFDPDIKGVINHNEGTITLEVPYNVNITDLAPTIVVSDGAEVSPESGKVQDFTNPVMYVVKAQDGTEKEYRAEVSTGKSSEKAITKFGFLEPYAVGVIDEANKEISVKVPYGTKLRGLKAVFEYSEGATVKSGGKEQISGVTARNFNEPVYYNVIAQDGSRVRYKVTVTVGQKSEKSINEFTFTNISPAAKGVIDADKRSINVTVPEGTDVTSLIASFTFTGKSVQVSGIEQVSGKTPNDFTKPVVYTVIAHDDTDLEYIVNAAIEKADDK